VQLVLPWSGRYAKQAIDHRQALAVRHGAHAPVQYRQIRPYLLGAMLAGSSMAAAISKI
jgi:hypothetical protein